MLIRSEEFNFKASEGKLSAAENQDSNPDSPMIWARALMLRYVTKQEPSEIHGTVSSSLKQTWKKIGESYACTVEANQWYSG